VQKLIRNGIDIQTKGIAISVFSLKKMDPTKQTKNRIAAV
jgi:hypothetical protein